MRIHGIMLVKNEADMIGETLESAVQWCDAIYVYDNGSTDGTWEIVQETAAENPRIVPFKQEDKPFSQTIRGEVFRHYRAEAATGDWWCILDGDEIYIDDPRAFLARVPAPYGEVWSSSYQYYFTDDDLGRYEADPRAFLGQRVQDRVRYYRNNWSESRFMRHHRGLLWPEDREGHVGFKRPVGRGLVYPHRIRLKHYQYRSPEQIEARLKSRLAVTGSYRHEQRPDWIAGLIGREAAADRASEAGVPSWRDRIVPARVLHHDGGEGDYVGDAAALPVLPRNRYGLRRLKQGLQSAWWRLHRDAAAGARAS